MCVYYETENMIGSKITFLARSLQSFTFNPTFWFQPSHLGATLPPFHLSQKWHVCGMLISIMFHIIHNIWKLSRVSQPLYISLQFGRITSSHELSSIDGFFRGCSLFWTRRVHIHLCNTHTFSISINIV